MLWHIALAAVLAAVAACQVAVRPPAVTAALGGPIGPVPPEGLPVLVVDGPRPSELYCSSPALQASMLGR